MDDYRNDFWTVLILIAILFTLTWFLGDPAEAKVDKYDVYVVQPDDKIDLIVKKRYPDRNIAEMRYEVQKLNGKDGELLDPGKIFPGMRLKLPAQ